MTADEALALAKYQRPGVKLIVGPTEAREVRFYREVYRKPDAVEPQEPVAPLRRGILAGFLAALRKVFG